MKHFWKRVTAVALSAVMSFSLIATALAVEQPWVDSDETVDVMIEGTYHQTKARESLTYVNEFRKTNDGYKNQDGSTNTSTVGTLSDLTYDYDLEEVAMLRAAEIAVYFSHTRPDGRNRSTAFTELDYPTGANGENIFYGYSSQVSDPEYVINALEEANEDYSGQGHRRIMLGSSYTNYAMGCFELDGYYFWAMIVTNPSETTNTTTPTTANDKLTDVTFTVSDSYVDFGTLSYDIDEYLDTMKDSCYATGGGPLPNVYLTLTLASGKTSTVQVYPHWTSSNEDIIAIYEHVADSSILNGSYVWQMMYYLLEGESTISTTVNGTEISFTLTVQANQSFPDSDTEGCEHLNAELLDFAWNDPETDVLAIYLCHDCNHYIEYACTISIVTVQPTYSYPGSVTYTATSTKDANDVDVLIVAIDELQHNYGEPEFIWSDDYTSCIARFTCTDCGDTQDIICTVSDVTVTDPSCTTEGSIHAVATCEFNDETYDNVVNETIPKTEHTFSGNEADLTWNWSADKSSATASYTCTVCGEEVTVNAVVTYSDSDSSCTKDITRTYTATVEINGEFYYDSVDVDIPAQGHNLSATFDWYEDNGEVKCTAHITCSRGDVDEYLDCVVAVKNSTPATCTTDGETTYTASIGYAGEEFTAPDYTVVTEVATGHNFGTPTFAWSSDYSKCEATFTCTKCNYSYTENCSITDDYTAPTCTDEGLHIYTATVGQYSDSQFIYVDALGHTWNSGVITKEPNCIDEGTRTYTCTRCGATYNEAIPANGEHTWNDGVVTKEATCTEDGVITYTCIICGATYDVPIPASGEHTWNSGVVTKEPTCTETGIMTYTCTECGATETVTLEALGHNYTTNTVEPTCTEDGYTTHTCTRCGESYTDSYVSALGHNYQTQFSWASDYSSCTIYITCSRGDYNESFPCTITKTVTKEAGCETLGETTYTATYNGLSSVVVVADIPALDHIYNIDTFVWYDSEGHTWEFNGEQDEDFVWDENVSCLAYLTCSRCGKNYVADCTITIEHDTDANGTPITIYTASVGDSGLFFSVTQNDESGRIIGVSSSEGEVSGAEIGDTSAEEANANLGEIISMSEEGTLDMPDAQPTDSNGGEVQTGDIIGIVAIGLIPFAICGIVLARDKKKEEVEG